MVVNRVIVCLLEKVAAGDFGSRLIFCALLRADSYPVCIETQICPFLIVTIKPVCFNHLKTVANHLTLSFGLLVL